MTRIPKLSQAAMKYFTESGITRAEAETMRIRDVDTAELAKLLPLFAQKIVKFQVMAHEIPYFSIDGKPTGYCRYRLHHNDSSLPKYLQPKDSKPEAYFPPFCDWKKICADPTIALCITEGERKAAKACLSGFPCIGLGGVWNWSSNGAEV